MAPEEEKTTSPSSARALIEEALESIVVALDELPDGAKTRELRRKAESFRRILDAWELSRPTGMQLETVGDGISSLHAKTVETLAEVRRESLASRGDESPAAPPKKRHT